MWPRFHIATLTVFLNIWTKVRVYFAVNNSTQETAEGHCNESMLGDDGGYYNTDMLSTDIRINDLRHVISEKSKGENSIFHSEYKVNLK